jgi:hypothetical protein
MSTVTIYWRKRDDMTKELLLLVETNGYLFDLRGFQFRISGSIF